MPHPDSEGHTAGYLGYTSALSCLIVKDRDALLQATDALLSALAMSSLVMPACCKAVMLGMMGEDVGLACRVEAPQSSVLSPQAHTVQNQNIKTAHAHVWTGQ